MYPLRGGLGTGSTQRLEVEKHPNKYKPDGATDGMDEQGGERESLFLIFALFQPVRSVYKFYLTLFRTRGLAGRTLTVPLRFRRSRRDGGLVLTPISSLVPNDELMAGLPCLLAIAMAACLSPRSWR